MRNREYAIRLRNSKYGDFYFHYESWYAYGQNYNSFIFSKKTKGVKKWKINENVISEINRIKDDLKNRNRIVFECTDLVKNGIIDTTDKRLLFWRKKYYLFISNFSSDFVNNRAIITQKIEDLISKYKNITDDFQKELSNLNIDKKNIDKIYNDISKIQLRTSNTLFNLGLIKGDIDKYRQQKYYEEKSKNDMEENFIDIVDVSFNFRCLKMKTIINQQ